MTKVAVLDMQPITPAVGGGRLRVLGLYHALGANFETTYVGTYDWPGEARRKLRLSESLVEIDVPLSSEHFRRDAQWRDLAQGATVIDAAFPILGRLSGDFLMQARRAAADADVIVFSHPWLYPLLSDGLDRARQMVAYDAQNAEGLLRHELLGGTPFGLEIAKSAAMAEAFLCRDADLVVGCSDEDLDFFAETYGISRSKTAVVRNGVFVKLVVPSTATSARAAKMAAGVDGPVAIFVGSNYQPNREAAHYIIHTLAPAMPEVLFLLCGGVGSGTWQANPLPANVRCTGNMSDDDKLRYLHAADVALNPMFSGSGTNIKMFEFMAAGLPIVATRIGARGICDATTRGVVVCAADAMTNEVRRLIGDDTGRARLGRENRAWVETEFAWETLSPSLGTLILEALEKHDAAHSGATDVATSQSESPVASRAAAETVPKRRIGILSTFGIRCGIAEYSRYLTEALQGGGIDITIVANRDGREGVAVNEAFETLNGVAVHRAWRYDAATWKDGGDNAKEAVRVLRAQSASHLNVQYHRAFFSEDALVEMIRTVLSAGITVSVTLHNSSDASEELLRRLEEMRVRVLVHHNDEQQRLRLSGVDAWYVPQGVRRRPDPDYEVRSGRLKGSADGPLIASFGFLRPHKGLVELVEALSILRGVLPGIRLLAQTSLYPSPDSADYLGLVRRRIDALDLRAAVVLDTEFLPIEKAIARLAATDLIVLPYAASDEGSSAAAATALAARRPLVTTKARIFDDVRSVAYAAEDNSPPVLAAAISTVLTNGPLWRHLGRRAQRLADTRDWQRVATRFVELVTSDAPNKGGDGMPHRGSARADAL